MTAIKNIKALSFLPDIVSILAHCAQDSTFLLTMDVTRNEYWIPTIGVAQGDSYQLIKDEIFDIFGINITVTRILRFGKIWVPNQAETFITHIVFELVVPLEIKKKVKMPLGKYRGKILWVTEDELTLLYENSLVKSPEIFQLTALVRRVPVTPYNHAPTDEYVFNANYMEVAETALHTLKDTAAEQLVNGSRFDRKLQEHIYTIFLKLSHPVVYMSIEVFSKFVIALGWDKDECPHLFYSADHRNRKALSFREFLHFLAATEPGTSHGGGPAELRCRYIFRYLDRGRKNCLRKEDMRFFVTAVRKSKNLPLEQDKIDKELADCYKTMKILDSQTITLNQFLANVGELKLRGTSQIFRSPIGIEKHLSADSTYTMNNRQKTLKGFERVNNTIHKTFGGSRRNIGCYELANHTMTIKNFSTANVDPVATFEAAISSMSLMRLPFGGDALRQKSFDYFGTKTVVNDLIKSIRYLVKINKSTPTYSKVDNLKYNWGQLDPSVILNVLKDVCSKVKEMVKNEPRLLQIYSPVYIMGDLHGNIADLFNFEKMLWPLGPGICPCNLLFLGDYVDRGVFSIEVITYLLAYKLLAPGKINLIRGNHEIKRVQQMWTFEVECKKKFGDKLGPSLFDAINDVFDLLPLAAVVDAKVFCCHGGIPPPWLCPTAIAINDIPVLLNNPQEQSSLAWELMWNDPIRGSMPENTTHELMANEGFAINFRRGTGHVFSVEALEKFLVTNEFTHLIRAHEVAEAGFNLQQKGKMFTVFSSSKYCNSSNEAACILADQGRLRVFRVSAADE